MKLFLGCVLDVDDVQGSNDTRGLLVRPLVERGKGLFLLAQLAVLVDLRLGIYVVLRGTVRSRQDRFVSDVGNAQEARQAFAKVDIRLRRLRTFKHKSVKHNFVDLSLESLLLSVRLLFKLFLLLVKCQSRSAHMRLVHIDPIFRVLLIENNRLIHVCRGQHKRARTWAANLRIQTFRQGKRLLLLLFL